MKPLKTIYPHQVRIISSMGKKAAGISLPIYNLRELEWKVGDKLIVKKYEDILIVRKWAKGDKIIKQ